MTPSIPELSLVVLIGPSGSGKSSFARKHFKPTEVLSSDYCRGIVSDDENDQAATNDAFEVLHFIARKRLAAGRSQACDGPQPERIPVADPQPATATAGAGTGHNADPILLREREGAPLWFPHRPGIVVGNAKRQPFSNLLVVMGPVLTG